MSDDEVPEVVTLPIEDSLDLHPFPPAEIPDVVRSYLEAAVQAGLVEVRLVHGKGKGVQRDAVHRTLRAIPYVDRFTDAPPEHGGWGATIVWLNAWAQDA